MRDVNEIPQRPFRRQHCECVPRREADHEHPDCVLRNEFEEDQRHESRCGDDVSLLQSQRTLKVDHDHPNRTEVPKDEKSSRVVQGYAMSMQNFLHVIEREREEHEEAWRLHIDEKQEVKAFIVDERHHQSERGDQKQENHACNES